MNAFFKVVTENETYEGVVFGEDEKEIMERIVKTYSPDEVTFKFGEFYDSDVVELTDLKEHLSFDSE